MSVEERIISTLPTPNCNFATDLRIIANTPFALLQKRRMYKLFHYYMFLFNPLTQ